MSLHGLPLPCGWWLFTGLGATVNNLRVAVTQVTFMTRAVKKVFKKKIIKKHMVWLRESLRVHCFMHGAWMIVKMYPQEKKITHKCLTGFWGSMHCGCFLKTKTRVYWDLSARSDKNGAAQYLVSARVSTNVKGRRKTLQTEDKGCMEKECYKYKTSSKKRKEKKSEWPDDNGQAQQRAVWTSTSSMARGAQHFLVDRPQPPWCVLQEKSSVAGGTWDSKAPLSGGTKCELPPSLQERLANQTSF